MKTTVATTFALLLPLAAAAQPPAGNPSPSLADSFMNSLDANKDGKVDKAEFLKPYEAQFQSMDTNGDGAIDRGEIEAVEKKVRERMQQMRQQQGRR
jgi:Ca2+-binding EF-hand superfamily protein